ncbi:MAG: hypothetical protein IJT07_01465 [Oscillospiraceae bacterium]|nr:hypothetical protein [Oscillospiraceae bacterium]
MEEKTEGVSTEKRLALLRYLEILFLVAFALVVISLILQMHSTNSTISNLTEASESMLSRAETLQKENRELQDKVATLKQELKLANAETEDLRIAYEALSAVLASPYTMQTVEYAKEIETVYNYKSYYTESAWALFESYLAHANVR